MLFPLPVLPLEFEIPDAWWAEAGMTGFIPKHPAYRSTAAASRIPLRNIEPPVRFPERLHDWRGFERHRLVKILSGIAANAEIEPVPVYELQPVPLLPIRYQVIDGYHRYYASVAAGFDCLPVLIRQVSGEPTSEKPPLSAEINRRQ
jgi:hypothetical protein